MHITYLCKEFNTLPGPGGVLDQRDIHLRKMVAVLRAQSDHEAMEADRRDRQVKNKYGVQNQ